MYDFPWKVVNHTNQSRRRHVFTLSTRFFFNSICYYLTFIVCLKPMALSAAVAAGRLVHTK